jgi:phage replication initiation protein
MNTAFIDFLGVTFRMDATNAKESIEILLRGWLGVEVRVTETGKGWNGYKHRLDIEGVGLVAFGGNNETVHIEVTGSGCMQVKDWSAVADSLDMLEAWITRLDLAVDDFEGTTYNLEWCKRAFADGEFNPARGARPVPRLIDDMGSGKGCTFYLGARESGKLFRGYEKGKEQGEPESPWFRCEVEWRNRNREIPVQAIREPGKFFAGAYPAFKAHALEQRTITTVAHIAQAHIEKATDHARKQAGRVIHALLALGLKVEEVMARIHVPELPKKLAAPIRAFLALDESERTYTPAIAPAWASRANPEEVADLYKAFRLQRATWRVGQGTNGTNPLTGTAAPEWAPILAA